MAHILSTLYSATCCRVRPDWLVPDMHACITVSMYTFRLIIPIILTHYYCLIRELSLCDREAKEKAADYKSRCRIFFVEMVSRMCFAEDTSPDDDMIQMLLDLVTGQQAGEQKAPDAGDDKSQPVVDIRLDLTTQVIRSVLLQHLIRKW